MASLSRTVFRYQSRRKNDEELIEWIRSLAQKHPRYGYRRVLALVRRGGLKVNHKRVQRLWQKAKLQLTRKPQRKRAKASVAANPLAATHPNHVWTYDFVFDRCVNGQKLKMLTVEDEFTREGLAIEVATSIKAEKVILVLARLIADTGAPECMRSDNGPEFIAAEIKRWLEDKKIRAYYIEPGCPWQNGKGESFNGKFRDECLNMELFQNTTQAKVVIEIWRRFYNEERPHSSLGYRTPREFYELHKNKSKNR